MPDDLQNLVQPTYKINKEDIVIYPESVSANPLNAERVCRYILARPYTLNGSWVDYDEKDFVLNYSNVISGDGCHLNLQNEILHKQLAPYLNCQFDREDKVAIYYGKLRPALNLNIAKTLAKRFQKIEIITRKYPSNKSALYKLISESRLLISLDPLSNLSYESTLLGTPVYIADSIFEKEYENYNFPLRGFLSTDEALLIDYSKFCHEQLSMNAISEFQLQLSDNEKKVIEVIREIEKHFAIGSLQDIARISEADRRFISERWGRAPIVQGSNFNSVVGYHLIKFNPWVYVLGKILWRCVSSFLFLKINNLLLGFKNLIKEIIDYSDPTVAHTVNTIFPRKITDHPSKKNSFSTSGKEKPVAKLANNRIKALVVNLIWKGLWKSH